MAKKFVVSKKMASWLKLRQGRLFAIDTSESDPNYFKSSWFQLLSEADVGVFFKPENQLEFFRTLESRNQIMAKKILEQFQNGNCQQGLLIVGSDHLMSPEIARLRSASDFVYRPLASLIQSGGVSATTVLLAWTPYEELGTDYQFRFVPFDSPDNTYDLAVGEIWWNSDRYLFPSKSPQRPNQPSSQR